MTEKSNYFIQFREKSALGWFSSATSFLLHTYKINIYCGLRPAFAIASAGEAGPKKSAESFARRSVIYSVYPYIYLLDA
jgi:hypothetical protein